MIVETQTILEGNMRRTAIALPVVLVMLVVMLALALAGCGAASSTARSTPSAPTTMVVLGSGTTAAPTTASTEIATTTSEGTTTTEAITTTEAPTTTTTEALVKVPSYTKFHGSYTGDDWGKVLSSWEAAVKAGFKKVGLVADLTLVAPGDPEYQKPKAGTMVKKGTVVHIHVAVYD